MTAAEAPEARASEQETDRLLDHIAESAIWLGNRPQRGVQAHAAAIAEKIERLRTLLRSRVPARAPDLTEADYVAVDEAARASVEADRHGGSDDEPRRRDRPCCECGQPSQGYGCVVCLLPLCRACGRTKHRHNNESPAKDALLLLAQVRTHIDPGPMNEPGITLAMLDRAIGLLERAIPARAPTREEFRAIYDKVCSEHETQTYPGRACESEPVTVCEKCGAELASEDEYREHIAYRVYCAALLASRPDADACAETLRAPKWIRFVEVGTSESGKTRRWTVVTKDSRQRIGDISWYSHWRRYAFAAVSDCVFEQDCLRDIAAFCEDETRKHRAAALASGTDKEADHA